MQMVHLHPVTWVPLISVYPISQLSGSRIYTSFAAEPAQSGSSGHLAAVRKASLARRRVRSIRSFSGDRNSSARLDVAFPNDYDELLEQAKSATEYALNDQKQLMEIEFPTSGLDSVPGDGEGGIEMTGSMQLIREFCDSFLPPEKATKTRIFFPEANEVNYARKLVFSGSYFKLDYLTKPSLFEDFGFVNKVKMTERVKPEDETFLAAYPYFNVNEMIVVEELYRDTVVGTNRKLIIFNGELDRIRSGYYPSFFYPKLAALTKTLFPNMETVYYIHNFKGRSRGVLFSCRPIITTLLCPLRFILPAIVYFFVAVITSFLWQKMISVCIFSC